MNDMSSPSAWHEDAAYGRHPDHDTMQLRFVRLLKSKPIPTTPSYGECQQKGQPVFYQSPEEVTFTTMEVDVEVPTPLHDKIIAFADIMICLKTADAEYSRLLFYELKPKIQSIGAVIRQCYALQNAVRRVGRRHFRVLIVVFKDDPKAADLEELSPFQVVTMDRGETA